MVVGQPLQEDADEEDGVAAGAGAAAGMVAGQHVRPGPAVVELLLGQGHGGDPPGGLQVERVVGGPVEAHDGLERPAGRALVRAQGS